MIHFVKCFFKLILNSSYRFFILSRETGIYNNMEDESYLRKKFESEMGENLNFNSCTTFNQKLQWLKLNNRKKIYTVMVDKLAVKKLVEEKIGSGYTIPTLGVWQDFDEIEFNKLPEHFVLKCTHDSGGLVICKDKTKFDIVAARRKIEKCLNRNFYYKGREWPYKDVHPQIIAEKYLEINEGNVVDYKLHCFNGKVRFVLTCSERFSETGLKEDFYDLNWNRMDVKRPNHPNSIKGVSKPLTLNKMIEIAEIFSEDIPFLRVDFYEVEGKLFFGEFTFYPASGYEHFEPRSYDDVFGSWLKT